MSTDDQQRGLAALIDIRRRLEQHIRVPADDTDDLDAEVLELIARRKKHRLINAETAVLPSPHVLDHFRLDLLLGQVQFEDRFLPGNQQPLHVELGQLQKITLGCPRAAGD